SFETPPTPALYPLSLHDALPISSRTRRRGPTPPMPLATPGGNRPETRCHSPSSSGREVRSSPVSPARLGRPATPLTASAAWKSADRKSTRLNSSHVAISYAVFCL